MNKKGNLKRIVIFWVILMPGAYLFAHAETAETIEWPILSCEATMDATGTFNSYSQIKKKDELFLDLNGLHELKDKIQFKGDHAAYIPLFSDLLIEKVTKNEKGNEDYIRVVSSKDEMKLILDLKHYSGRRRPYELNILLEQPFISSFVSLSCTDIRTLI